MSNDTQQQSGNIIKLLTSLQQGVVAINKITQTMKSTFPSS